ncbi:hypothetical protein [Paracoccus tibetensis]|uniref:hypothetical protein n=1 Tax=Paracoccus tibetensis TaxID=336292 RepID=UPI001113BDD4|nr:hypothetical protein [Paracoccus tibetensis]
MSAVASPAPEAKPFRHGTPGGYSRHKCRCDACRAAEIDRQRNCRARLRAGLVKHRSGGKNCVPVRIRGVVYPSISAAAAALGTSAANISAQLARFGDAERAGTGIRGARRPGKPGNAKQCRIHSRLYPSLHAVAKDLGVSYTYLSKQASAGFTPEYSQYLLARMMRKDADRVAA